MTKRLEDYYSMLGVPRSVTQSEIRNAYLKAAKRLHPDKNVGPGETELFMEVQQAYQILSNPAARTAYDATLPPEEIFTKKINSHIMVSRSTLPTLTEKQLVYVLVEVSPSAEYIDSISEIPINLCLVLDCSTSMSGEKLNTIKETARQLIRKLKSNDIFSIVMFNDRAKVVIPAAKQADLRKMENPIRLLQTSGGTEIFQGLKTGMEEVTRYLDPKFVNHIILLTDGHTYGDEQACYELAKIAAKNKIGISGIGIGSDWNDQFLEQLARTTSGYSMLVTQPEDIERLLTEKFVNLSNTFAESVNFEYELGEGVEIGYAIRTQPETDPIISENPMRMGPLLKNFPLSVLMELIVHPREITGEKLSLLEGKLDISLIGDETQVPYLPVNVILPVKNTSSLTPPHPAIIQALSKVTLFRMQEKARKEVLNGNYAKATQHLQRLATHLLTTGEQKLARTILLEIQNIEKERKFTGQGEKQIKYGTRALLLPVENTRGE